MVSWHVNRFFFFFLFLTTLVFPNHFMELMLKVPSCIAKSISMVGGYDDDLIG